MKPPHVRPPGWLYAMALIAILGFAASVAHAASATQPATQPASSTAPATQPATQPGAALPFIHINRKAGYVDLDAAVAQSDGKWLELLACTPHTREYESILKVKAKPSQIHLALLMLGLKPGRPQHWQAADDGDPRHGKLIPPSGPKVAVFLITRDADGKTHTTPANQWIVNQKTHKVMAHNVWLFTGSRFTKYKDKTYYMADMNGSVISLVNFGDEILGRPTNMTNRNDNEAWNANVKVVPKVGTPVVIRLRPVK